MLFVFKQKTAYEMRISDWSSVVCASDLFGSGSLLCSAFAQEEAGSAAPATVPEDASWETPLKTIPLAPEKPAALPAQDPERRPSGIEERWEESRVGKRCVSTCQSLLSPYH